MLIHTNIAPIYTVQEWLPSAVNASLTRIDRETMEKISEIRMRKNGIITVTIDGRNRLLTSCGVEKESSCTVNVTGAEIDDFIYKACKGSVYSHEATLNSFYITHSGIRIGLGGSVDAKGNINEITSVNIRIPCHVSGCSSRAYEYFEKNGIDSGKGLLVISPPGVGKTTLLRDHAQKLSCCRRNSGGMEMKRVCVIDERYEIFMPHVFDNCCVDFISGTDKQTGIERAVRLLSPEIIICDEISGEEEAKKITKCKHNGTVFVASFHCEGFEYVMKNSFISRMFDEGVFGGVCALKRGKNGKVISEVFTLGEGNA